MRKGILASLRNMRRWVIQAVALAFVLPALIGLLPEPALSAAAALDRDIMASVCGQQMPQHQDGSPLHAGHEHCVLCASHGAASSPSLADAAPAFAPAPRRAGVIAAATPRSMAPPLQALLDASPPRGPPPAV